MKDKDKDKDKDKKVDKSKNQKFELIVVEALQDDAYKGIARIDSEIMRELDIKRGDVILIKGNRETVAIADRSYPADIGEGRIRIDGILRKNARAGLGEVVQISKANVHEAKKVIIAPAQQGIMVQGDPDNLRRGLLGRTLVKGDVVILGGVQRRKDLMSEGMGDLNDIFGNLGDILGGMGMGNLGGGVTQIRFIVVSTNPCLPVIITENTEVVLNSKAVDVSSDNIPEINYEDIGGLSEEIKKIREMVEIPMKHPEIFQRLGVEPPKGVLLYGPPGTGKTLLAKAVANESEANFILLNGPEIMSKFYGESEKKIRDIFDEAEKTAPTIIFIDELDAIAPALRRPGRFDREIEIGVPNKEGRLAILKIHTRGMPLTKDVDLVKLAQVTHGFVGADLESLTKEAAMNVLRKLLPEMKLDSEEQISPQILEKLVITAQDFTDALRVVRPSAMREVLVETPNVDWNSVGGLDDVKRELKEAVEWPMKHPEGFKRLNVRPPKGVLLYGPPGTGKTLLAKAAAKESDVNFISVKGPSLLSKWVNDSHKGVAKVFEKARQVSPCIVLIDEIESIASKRGMVDNASGQEGVKVLNQLLSDMDGLEDLKDILIVATTNRPDLLDPAILRPGRFDKILLINAPSEKGRKMILDIHTVKTPLAKDVIISELAKQTEGYTGADLEALVREAAMLALRESVDAVEVWKKHFDEALKKVKPSVSKSTIETYKKIEDKFLESARAAIPQDNSYFG